MTAASSARDALVVTVGGAVAPFQAGVSASSHADGVAWPDSAWWAAVRDEARRLGVPWLDVVADAALEAGRSAPPEWRTHAADVTTLVCAEAERLAAGRPPAGLGPIVAALREHSHHASSRPPAAGPGSPPCSAC
jgi:hypothetical protein